MSEQKIGNIVKHSVIVSFLIAIAFVFLLCSFFNLYWETNDDVGMSMAAHGYGLVAKGSPNLIFSNIIWGYIVRYIPSVCGILGYTFATLISLVVIGGTLVYVLRRLQGGYATAVLSVFFILTRPILFPQFTINSGLLMVAAIGCWVLYEKEEKKGALICGALLAFFSYLVRAKEFFFVLLVALPLLPWKYWILSFCHFKKYGKVLLLNFLFLIMAIGSAWILNNQAYRGEEWKAFRKWGKPSSLLVDFSYGEELQKHPEILEEYGYTRNDIELLKSWFFVDPAIANPPVIQKMIDRLGLLPSYQSSLAKGWLGVKNLLEKKLLILFLMAIFSFLLYPDRKVLFSWTIFITALFILGFLGRPAVSRIYVPLLDLLLIAPFLVTRLKISGNSFFLKVLVLAFVINLILSGHDSYSVAAASKKIEHDLQGLPKTPIIVWGAPYEEIFPVFGTETLSERSYQFYALGGFTLAPTSVAAREQQEGRGLKELIANKKEFQIIADENLLSLLKIYAKEHFQMEFQIRSIAFYGNRIKVLSLYPQKEP